MINSQKKFRLGVAIIVINSDGLILACHRSDRTGAWQLPQGGVETGESAEQAMYRELEEEIGTSEVKILQKLPDTIKYEWPEHLYDRGFHGQEHHYFLVRLKNPQSINLEHGQAEPEFDQIQWLTKSEFKSKLFGFKATAYIEAIDKFEKLTPGIFKD